MWEPRIPASGRAGIQALLKLHPDDFPKISDIASKASYGESSHGVLVEGLIGLGLNPDQAKAADSFLHGIHILRYRYSGTTPEFLEALKDPFREIGADVEAAKSEVNELINFLEDYLSKPSSQQRHAKEVALAYDVPARITDASIISDIRPILLGEDMEEIEAAILMNTLRLHIVEDGESVVRYFSLSRDARDSIERALNRLQRKEQLFKSKYGEMLVEDSGHAD